MGPNLPAEGWTIARTPGAGDDAARPPGLRVGGPAGDGSPATPATEAASRTGRAVPAQPTRGAGPTPATGVSSVPFPSGPFLWGAATSAYQVEENHGACDWHDFRPAGEACAHRRLYPLDLDALAGLGGMNAYRFSVEWSAIEPEPGRFAPEALAHYAAIAEACRRRGLRPVITLWHFTLPRWFARRGGWLHPAAPADFARFAARVAAALPAPLAWITLNEPTVYVVMGYIFGVWPPGRRGDVPAARRVLARLREAHRLALAALRAHGRVPVGIAHHYAVFESASAVSAAGLADRLFNRAMLGEPADFLGLNYYTRFRVAGVRPVPPDPVTATDMGWEVYPAGLERALLALCGRGLPIVVTENGIATGDDGRRAAYIEAHVAALGRAAARGADVRGYLYWSLLDNFEWVEGYRPRFGLLAVDRATQARTVRPSARRFGELAATARITPACGGPAG